MKLKKEIDFYGHRRIYYGISIGILVIALVWALISGVKIDIQFTGGTVATYSYTGDLSADSLEQIAEESTGRKASAAFATSITSGEKTFSLNFTDRSGLPVEDRSALTAALVEKLPDSQISEVSVESVSASMGADFLLKCSIAVLASFILMTVYVAFRFKRIGGWSAGVSGIVALFHDILIVLAAFIFFGFSIDDNFMAVVLFILGYSINDTIVIYDRIRENKRLYGRSMDLPALVNKSVNQTLNRTLNTTISTLIAMGSICVCALIFNVSSILTFAVPMAIGLVSGTYSTVCIATTVWTTWQLHKEKKGSRSAKKKRA